MSSVWTRCSRVLAGRHPALGKVALIEHLVAPRHAPVAEQDRRRGPERLGRADVSHAAVVGREAPVHRGPAAAGVAAVHNVVVDQRPGVQQL